MTVFNGTIDDFAIGDDLAIERTIESIPDSITLATAWFMVKRKLSDVDADALITKTITAVANNDGHISDTGIDGTGILTFYLTSIETALLTPLRDYKYSIKIKMSNDKVYTPEVGLLTAYPTVKLGST